MNIQVTSSISQFKARTAGFASFSSMIGTTLLHDGRPSDLVVCNMSCGGRMRFSKALATTFPTHIKPLRYVYSIQNLMWSLTFILASKLLARVRTKCSLGSLTFGTSSMGAKTLVLQAEATPQVETHGAVHTKIAWASVAVARCLASDGWTWMEACWLNNLKLH